MRAPPTQMPTRLIYQRCRDYLPDGLDDSFDQTASYVYTDPFGDS